MENDVYGLGNEMLLFKVNIMHPLLLVVLLSNVCGGDGFQAAAKQKSHL